MIPIVKIATAIAKFIIPFIYLFGDIVLFIIHVFWSIHGIITKAITG